MGIDRPGGTDTRAENVEKPPAEDRPPAPPPDRPGSPGQPSRLESLRAAREAQEARRAETATQQTDTQDTGTEQPDEREKDKGEPSSAEPADDRQDAQAEPKAPERTSGNGETTRDAEAEGGERERESDRPESETGQAQPDGRDGQPYSTDIGELAPETGAEPRGELRDDKTESSSDGPSDESQDAPAEPWTAEERPMTVETEPEPGESKQPDGPGDEPPRQETGEADQESPGERDRPDDREAETEAPQDRDHQPLPQQDGRVPGDDGNEFRGEAGNEQKPQADNEPAGHDHTPQDEPAPADQQNGGSETPQAAEAPVRASDNPEPGDAPQVRVAWLPASEEGVTRWVSPIVQFNEQMPGNQLERRDRNAEDRPGTPATTEDEPNKYRDLPDRITDLTPGRGELRNAEDDAENQDLREPDPDRTRRSERVRRRIGRETENATDVSKKLGNKIGSFLDDHPPGPLQTTTGRDVPNFTMPQHNMKLGNGAIGLAIGTIVLVKAGQRVYGASKVKVSELLERRHGGNG
ncbi:hypothetical protein [Spirillospora sp. NPDC048823]|uniref:hypothetical protein n=1 Tax=unclassified Spirillospora TaxID=2642701 RepID=UPI00370FFECA